ncbi:MAG: acyl-CoA dehydrogenase family protein [Patulibacter sp.]
MTTQQDLPTTTEFAPADGPVRPGSPELAQLLAAIGDGAFERERDEVAPHNAVDLVRQARLGALRVPTELGGAGATAREAFETFIALGRVDPNVAHILRAHYWFVEARRASPDLAEREHWLTEAARGSIFGNASTELGTENTGAYQPTEFQTVLSPDPERDGEFRLNGTKYYSTGSLYSDWVAVIASTPQSGIATAIVPANRDGVQLLDDWDGIGQRLTGTGTSHFRDVVVHPHERVDDSARAELPSYAAPWLQLYLTAIIAGILESAASDAAELVRGRQRTYTHASADTPAADPLIQHVVGQLETNAFAARSIVLAAADALDAASDSVVDGAADTDLVREASLAAAKAKVAVDELAQRSGWLVFEAGGASATKQSYNLDRHWRNARTITSHNPSLYKTRAIGDLAINATPLPQTWFI